MGGLGNDKSPSEAIMDKVELPGGFQLRGFLESLI